MGIRSAKKTLKRHSCFPVAMLFTVFFFFELTTSFNCNKPPKSSLLHPLLTQRFGFSELWKSLFIFFFSLLLNPCLLILRVEAPVLVFI